MQLNESQKQQVRDYLLMSNGSGRLFDRSIFGTSVAIGLLHYFTNGRRFFDSLVVFGTGALCGMTKYTLMEHNYIDNNGTQPMVLGVFMSSLIGSLSVCFGSYMLNHYKFIHHPASIKEHKDVASYLEYENTKFKSKHNINSKLTMKNVSKYTNSVYKVEYEIDIFDNTKSNVDNLDALKLFGNETKSFLIATAQMNQFHGQGKYEKFIHVTKIRAFLTQSGFAFDLKNFKNNKENNDENKVVNDVEQDVSYAAESNHNVACFVEEQNCSSMCDICLVV